MMRLLFSFFALMMFSTIEKGFAQVNFGRDFPSLSHLKWGMTFAAALDSTADFSPEASANIPPAMQQKFMGRDTLLSDSVIDYFDFFPGEKVKARLKFSKKEVRLVEIAFSLEDPNENSVAEFSRYLERQHGPPAKKSTKEKSFLFFTFRMSLAGWKLDQAELRFLVTSQGDTPLSAVAIYSPPKNE